MTRTLLVVPTGHGVGLNAASLGLLRAFDRSGIPVGFLKPLAQRAPTGRSDPSNALVQLIADVHPPEPLTAEYVEAQLSDGAIEHLMEEVVALAEPMLASAGVTIVQGLTPGPGLLYDARLDLALAKSLDADVVLVGTAYEDGEDVSPERIAESMAITARSYHAGEDVRVVGCVVNRMRDDSPPRVDALRNELAERRLALVGTNAYRPSLSWPRVRDVGRALHVRVLHEGDQDRRVSAVVIGARAVPGVLPALQEGRLVIVPGDRDEVVMAACLTALNGTKLAALLLTGGLDPDPRVWELTEAARSTGLPILSVPQLTYDTATAIYNLSPEVPTDDVERANAVADTVADGIDEQWLRSLLVDSRAVRRLSPAAFRHRLTVMARAAHRRIVLPEGAEPRTLAAAVASQQRGIARCVLLAPPDDVADTARRCGLTLPPDLEIVDASSIADRYVDRLVELRRHRGMTIEMARNQLADPIMVATLMLEAGDVDGLVSGAVHTTAQTIRPALQVIRTRSDARLVSSVFFMLLPDDVLIYADCAVNPDPDPEQLADIAVQSAATARDFGIDPRVAMISFSTGDSSNGSDIEKVVEATRIVRERAPDLAVDGPLQYDAASTASVGLSKAPASTVAGRANVYIFPDLNTGNTTYKAVQRSADVVSIGPVLQGLAKPVNDLSRGAEIDDIIYAIALTAIQAERPR